MTLVRFLCVLSFFELLFLLRNTYFVSNPKFKYFEIRWDVSGCDIGELLICISSFALEVFQFSQGKQSQRQSLRMFSVPLHDVLRLIKLPKLEFLGS